MIRNEVFNLENNLREAAQYRLSLRNSSEQTAKRRDLESLLLSKKNVFNRLRFFSPKVRERVVAEVTSFSFKNFSYFFYYCGQNQKTFKNKGEIFEKELNNFIEGIKREIVELSQTVKEANLELNSKYTKVKVYKSFLEKSFLEAYDYIDNKTERTVKKTERLVSNEGLLSLPVLYKNKVDLRSISILREETTSSDVPTEVTLNKDGKVDYLVLKLNNHTNGVKKKTRAVKLGLSLKFGVIRKVNKIVVNFNSELPIDLIKSKLKYKFENEYRELDCKLYKDGNADLVIYFDEISTSEIQIGFEQTKHFDNINVNKSNNSKLKKLINSSYLNMTFLEVEDVSARVYDFGIDSIDVSQTVYRSFGLHREKDFLAVNKPLTMQMKVESIISSENCFVEKEAHIVLYGDSFREAFKNPKSVYEKTPKINTVIPLSEGNLVERELLVFKNKQAKCKLYPDLRKEGEGTLIEERIKVYREGEILSIGEDYNISLDGGGSLISASASFGQIQALYSEKIAGDFYIELVSKPNKQDNYIVEYKLDREFYLEESKNISMIEGEVVFAEELESSVGFIRPRVLMRNGSKTNSSSVINEINLLVEEIESNENDFVELETFEEREIRSTVNVV
jgi:hypothetical protein